MDISSSGYVYVGTAISVLVGRAGVRVGSVISDWLAGVVSRDAATEILERGNKVSSGAMGPSRGASVSWNM